MKGDARLAADYYFVQVIFHEMYKGNFQRGNFANSPQGQRSTASIKAPVLRDNILYDPASFIIVYVRYTLIYLSALLRRCFSKHPISTPVRRGRKLHLPIFAKRRFSGRGARAAFELEIGAGAVGGGVRLQPHHRVQVAEPARTERVGRYRESE
jgi:hypothetical protein